MASPIFLENTLMEISFLQNDLDELAQEKKKHPDMAKSEELKFKDEEKKLGIKILNLKEKLHERRQMVKNKRKTLKSKKRFRRRRF